MPTLRALTLLLFCTITATVHAGTIRLTVYSDGLSCPSSCDAHVVFGDVLNGTEFAHKPGSHYKKCVDGDSCRICIESAEKQCLEATYRGSGPGHKTFDFTPAFYSQACTTTPEQPALAAKCEALKKDAKSLEGRLNCITSPENPKCEGLIAKAQKAREQDSEKYQLCRSVGQNKYNAQKPDAEKRTHDCAYEFKGTGGPNSHGTTWKKLLPGACRVGTFVGRDGLDCCSGNTLEDGPMGLECIGFYPKP